MLDTPRLIYYNPYAMPRKRIYKTLRPKSAYKHVPANLEDPKTGKVTKLTPMRRAVVRALVDSDSMADAANRAGVAVATVTNTWKMPAVQQYLREQLEAAGVTHGLIMQRIREGLDATKGKDKYNKARPDFAERRATAQLALRLQGLSEADKEEGGSVSANNIFNIVIAAREARNLDKPIDVTPEKDKKA